MYNLKGFIGIENLVSNTPGVIASIGELSTYAQTYSKDIGLYTSDLNRSLSLNVFSSKSTIDGVISVPQEIIDMSLSISNWIYMRQMGLSGVDTSETFLVAFVSQYSSLCENMNCGEMVQADNGKWFPQWITWKNRNYVAEDNQHTLWFSDSHFRDHYDEYEIVVVPPVADASLDIFFQPYTTVITAINARSYVQSMEAIQVARDNHPETILSAENYRYVNPQNTASLTPTNWTVLIYGRYGNDADTIRTSVIDHILANSTHTFNEWKVIFPDIFKTTEFLIYPRWMNYAVEQMVLQSGIYSGIVNLKKELDYLKQVVTDYSTGHIDSHATVMPYPYKSLSLDVIGGYENRDNLFEITQVYPDIINVSSTSLDYNRMSADTKGFLDKLAIMIPFAETMTLYSDLPVGFKKVVRNQLIYVAVTYMNIHFLVCSKLSTPNYV